MKPCKLSVIIPVYNTANYLEDCLLSVIRATEGKRIPAEILVIDDHSTDGSLEIARRISSRHSIIRILTTDRATRGPGYARNIALNQAVGEIIAFVDSDDLVKETIYERMLASLDYHRSDICVCDASRLRNSKETSSSPQNRAFSHITLPVTNLKESPSLVFGAFCWNTLARKTFLDENHIRFPEDIVYEDFMFCLEVTSKAKTISFIQSAEYIWRVRSNENPSITQTYADLRNLQDRTEMNRRVMNYIETASISPSVRQALVTKILMLYLYTMLEPASILDDEKLHQRMEIMGAFAREFISEKDYEQIPIIYHQMWKTLLSDDVEALRRCHLYMKKNYNRVPIIHNNAEYIIEPNPSIITVGRRNIRQDFTYTIPVCHIRSVSMIGNDLVLTGWLYFNRIEVQELGAQVVQADLYNDITGERIPLNTSIAPAEDLNSEKSPVLNYDDYTETSYNYLGCGFSIVLDLSSILETTTPGHYLICLTYNNPLKSGERILRGIHHDAIERLSGIQLENSRSVLCLDIDKRQTLQLNITEKTEFRRLAEENTVLKEKLSLQDEQLRAITSDFEHQTSSLKATLTELEHAKTHIHTLESGIEKKQSELNEKKSELKINSDLLQKERDRIQALRHSPTFRIGRIIMWIPRQIRKMFR